MKSDYREGEEVAVWGKGKKCDGKGIKMLEKMSRNDREDFAVAIHCRIRLRHFAKTRQPTNLKTKLHGLHRLGSHVSQYGILQTTCRIFIISTRHLLKTEPDSSALNN